MKIYSLKRKTIPKLAVLATGLTAAVLVATINPVPAQAFPNKQAECINCHGVGTVACSVTAVQSTTTLVSSATSTVFVSHPPTPAAAPRSRLPTPTAVATP